MRYLKGDKEYIRAGFFLRFTAEVGYAFLVSAQASYKFGYFEKNEKGEYPFKDLLPWTYHTALREGMNQTNRMRVICNSDSFRIYLNGVLAASFRDATYKMGKLFLVAEPSDKTEMDVAFSDLQLREVPRE
jgi:hypothetical protein